MIIRKKKKKYKTTKLNTGFQTEIVLYKHAKKTEINDECFSILTKTKKNKQTNNSNKNRKKTEAKRTHKILIHYFYWKTLRVN